MPIGIYNHKPVNEDTKRKISLTLKGRKPWNTGLTKDSDKRLMLVSEKLMGRKLPEETKNKMKGRPCYFSEEYLGKERYNKMNESRKEKARISSRGRKHSEETKRKISASNMGQKRSAETRLILSQKAKGRPCPKNAGAGKQGYREDIGHFVRSRWEANVCRIHQYSGQSYLYESKRFDLGDTTYCPDLLVFPGTEREYYEEIKGYKSPEWLKKEAKFRKMYPDIKLEVIDSEKYGKISNLVSGIIPNWE